MISTKSIPVEYGYSTEKWTAGSYGASVSGHPVSSTQLLHCSTGWLSVVNERLKDLLNLDEGWDGDSAPPINGGDIERGWKLAKQIFDLIPSVQTPMILPTANGGIVLEWTNNKDDLSIEFENGVQVFYDIHADDASWEGNFNDSPINPGELLLKYFS